MPAINRFCQRTTHIARMARSYSRRRTRSRVRAGHARDQHLLSAAPHALPASGAADVPRPPGGDGGAGRLVILIRPRHHTAPG